jgi:hypothetical protein
MKCILNITTIIFLTSTALCSQTVVKMVLPPQSEHHVSARTLFDEALPSGIPNAIGVMGYDVLGGYLPYTYQWLENETVLKQGDVALITPTVGKTYSLKVIDNKNCSIIIPIKIDNTKQGEAKSSSKNDAISHTWLTRTSLLIEVNSEIDEDIEVILYDINGGEMLNRLISADIEIPVSLLPGVYLLHTSVLNVHSVVKHVVL